MSVPPFFSGGNSNSMIYSWRQIDTVQRKLNWLSSQYGIDTSLPLGPQAMVNVVTALCDSGLRASSIRTYLGRVSTLHEINHFQPPVMPALASRMLHGLSHSETPHMRRLAISPQVMLAIKRRLRKSQWSDKRMRVFWAGKTPLLVKLNFMPCSQRHA